MPQLTEEQTRLLLETVKKAKPLTLDITKEQEEKALKECDEYIENGNKKVNDMIPLSVYYIISKLPEEKQIKFIKENIDFIKKHDEDIFLYTLMSPKSLSYYLSLNVLREIKNIDKELFQKIIGENPEGLVHGFIEEDYYKLYTDFYSELLEIENINFIDGIYFHNRWCYENFNTQNVNDVFEQQKIYNKNFIKFILDKYNDKISTFTT